MIELEPNNKIILKLGSATLDNKELRFELLQFLKKELANNEISLFTKIIEIEVEAKETPVDLYKKMVKENPKFDNLRKQLDLDF